MEEKRRSESPNTLLMMWLVCCGVMVVAGVVDNKVCSYSGNLVMAMMFVVLHQSHSTQADQVSRKESELQVLPGYPLEIHIDISFDNICRPRVKTASIFVRPRDASLE